MPQPEKHFKRTLVTSALPYANGPLHIGHLAGVYIPADIFVRFLRMTGEDVIFIGGSDEHGVPITIKARQLGVSPQEIVDKYHGLIKKSFEEFGISFSIYSRTSNKIHHDTASEFFRKMYDAGQFIEKVTEQYFDEEAGQFLADRYITGTCPVCGSPNAYGDQCEKCGSSLNATDLIDPKSVLSGHVPVMKKTKHWYLPLDQYEPWLREWILADHKDDWKTNVYGQCKSWIDQGLQPRAVTRDLDWGVKVPVEGAEGKVLYVWFDAPIGYISATKELTPEWETYWKDPETRLIHFIGKDNIVFHCIIFPAMLKGEGTFILPDNVPAFEFMNLENDKISTSRNWAVWLHEYLEAFPGKQDVLRYVLTANAPETKDNDFTWKDFQTKNNSELVAIFGNFVNRTLVLTEKYFGGKVPPQGELNPSDMATLNEMKQLPDRIADNLLHFKFREALSQMMNVARLGNKYLTENEPWKVHASDPKRVATVLNISLQLCAQLSIVAAPFLPFTAQKIRAMFDLPEYPWADAALLDWLPEGHPLNKPELLFEKIDDQAIDAQIEKLLATKKSNEHPPSAEPQFIATQAAQTSHPSPALPEIQYDDFSRLDIRTATIMEAEAVPNTDKLLKLMVDTGLDQRTIVSGIAHCFQPADLVGKQVLVLINLAPRRLRGIVSQGMILTAENPDGTLYLISPGQGTVNGAAIK